MKQALLVLCVSVSAVFAGFSSSEQISNDADPWWKWDYATGDWMGVRTTLEDKGVEISGGYTAEVWGNTTGGLKKGAVYTGLLDFGATLDLEKLAGWKGASVSTTWLWLSGRDASEDLVGNFLTISNIAGFNTLRMLELWFQQDFFQRGDDGPPGFSLRIGQLTADREFIISDYGALFTNGTFGWPAFLYTNVPEGGPGYPMGTLGIRVAVNPWEWMTLQSAVFQGSVFPQNVNRHGFRWDLSSDLGYFWINELQVRWNQGEDTSALPGQAKFGAWFQTADFADPFFDEDGLPLADADSSGIPETHRWNYGFYWILDQMLYREQGEPGAAASLSKDGKSAVAATGGKQVVEKPSNQGLGWFGRIAFEPQDRNFIGFYFDTGLVYTGLIPTRDEDQVGVGFVCAQLTKGARRTLELEGSHGVGAEMVLEVTYKAILTPWLYIQPDAQFIINPGGTRDLGNAFIIGGRVSMNF
ncbi:MAG TPA: carbohydrate porin [Terrimicrobiaceae bacterium]